MKTKHAKMIFGSALLLAVLVLGTLIAFVAPQFNRLPDHGRFEIVNTTEDTISSAVMYVARERFAFKDISPGTSVRQEFPLRDSHYVLLIDFTSGKQLHAELNYVTNGMEADHRFLITPTGIVEDAPHG